MSMSFSISIICLCLPILVLVITGVVGIMYRKDKTIFQKDVFTRIWNWLSIITCRSVISFIFASIFIAIALQSESIDMPISLLSTLSIFLITLTSIFIIIAFFTKIILSTRSLISKNSVSTVTLSETEITENNPTSIKIKLNAKIPWGYILKISEKVDSKLGGDLRAISTTTVDNQAIFEATIPLTKRGFYQIGPTHYHYQDIFGFSNVKLIDSQRFSLTILPEIPNIRKYDFKLTSSVGDNDKIITARINTDDYYATRPYVRGDDTRKMHWKLTAKTGNLVIRQAETTTISFQDLSIIILNVTPSQDIHSKSNTRTQRLHPKYKNVIEYALDSQIKIAGALIDFALRTRIPVNLYYYTQNGTLEKYKPYMDNPKEWKTILASIKLVSRKVKLTDISDMFEPNNAYIMTCSETNMKRLNFIFNEAKEKEVGLELMYTPITNHIIDFLSKTKKEKKEPVFTRMIKKIIFTKPYFEQRTIDEEILNFFKKGSIVKYINKDYNEILILERNIITTLNTVDVPYKLFYNNDMYYNEVDNIIKVLENG